MERKIENLKSYYFSLGMSAQSTLDKVLKGNPPVTLDELSTLFSENVWRFSRKEFIRTYDLNDEEIEQLKELVLSKSLVKPEASLGNLAVDSKPLYRLFTRPINECVNLTKGGSECQYPVGLQLVLDEALAIICREVEVFHAANGTSRKPLFGLSALARGGKTTTISLIFDELKNRGYNAMIISFNGTSKLFTLEPNESQSHAILRRITEQLVVEDAPEALDTACDIATLDEHISTDNFVLLIDEINTLGALDSKAAALLREMFINKKGRYLVVTTHVEISLNEPASTLFGVSTSVRPFLTVPLPCTYELLPLRNMSSACGTLNPLQIALLGGIPSLIYSTYAIVDHKPSSRFNSECISIDSSIAMPVLTAFIIEFITGKRVPDRSSVFDMFSIMDHDGP